LPISFADATILPRDLSEEAHVAAALELQHPFHHPSALEQDLLFAIEGAARLGTDVVVFSDRAMTILRAIQSMGGLRYLRPATAAGRTRAGDETVLYCLADLPAGVAGPIPAQEAHARLRAHGAIVHSGIHRPDEPSTPKTDAELRRSFLEVPAIEYFHALEADPRVNPLASVIMIVLAVSVAQT
jgi:hypothetical protein